MTVAARVSYGAPTMHEFAMAVPALDSGAGVPCWLARDADVTFAFSTRLGGVSRPPYDTLNLGRSTADDPEAVGENRRRLLAAIGATPERLATVSQVHGIRVRPATGPGLVADGDALVTRTRGLAIAVTVADCMPLVMTVPGAAAVVHSGWRGTADGMPAHAVAELCREALVPPALVHVYVGPSIRSCCYRVGDDVATRFPAATRHRVDGAWHLDLVAAARIQLAGAGILPDHVADLGECTACDAQRYFSHRRDAGTTGRMWAVAAL